mmetsp:Transcript_3855/g.8099  ORF Transcript_3855/g.8099 Transcript_3855/m.8099 type:complete len:235 (-) Transcript_3855:280-984(-)
MGLRCTCSPDRPRRPRRPRCVRPRHLPRHRPGSPAATGGLPPDLLRPEERPGLPVFSRLREARTGSGDGPHGAEGEGVPTQREGNVRHLERWRAVAPPEMDGGLYLSRDGEAVSVRHLGSERQRFDEFFRRGRLLPSHSERRRRPHGGGGGGRPAVHRLVQEEVGSGTRRRGRGARSHVRGHGSPQDHPVLLPRGTLRVRPPSRGGGGGRGGRNSGRAPTGFAGAGGDGFGFRR